MKRSRTRPTSPAGGLTPAIHAAAWARLEQDYAALVTGTATEDPRTIVTRIAAAGEVLAHLAQLAALAGIQAADEPARVDAVLAAARAGMAREDT